DVVGKGGNGAGHGCGLYRSQTFKSLIILRITLGNPPVEEPFVGLHPHHVETVQQPVQLLARERHHRPRLAARPVETVPLQALLPQAETVPLPVQDPHPVPRPVAEHEQLLAERIELQRLLDQRSESVDALPEVHRLPAQIYRRQLARRPHHSPFAAPSTAASADASTAPENPISTPFGSTMCQAIGIAVSATSNRSNVDPVRGPDSRVHKPRAVSFLRQEYIIDTDRPCSCAYAFVVWPPRSQASRWASQ